MISLIFSIFILCQPVIAQELAPGFIEGVTAYQNKEYQKAQNVFQSLLEQHPQNPTLIYNLGLAEFQLGNQGLALGLWRKARNLDPGSKNIQAAIAYSEDLLFPSENNPTFIQGVANTLLNVPLNVWMLLSLLSLAVAGYLAIEHGTKQKKPFFQWPTGFYFFLPLFIFAASLAATSLFEKSRHKATVVEKNLLVHTGPSDSTPTLSELKEGQTILVLNNHDGWLQIRTLNGDPGWVPGKSVIAFGGL